MKRHCNRGGAKHAHPASTIQNRILAMSILLERTSWEAHMKAEKPLFKAVCSKCEAIIMVPVPHPEPRQLPESNQAVHPANGRSTLLAPVVGMSNSQNIDFTFAGRASQGASHRTAPAPPPNTSNSPPCNRESGVYCWEPPRPWPLSSEVEERGIFLGRVTQGRSAGGPTLG